MRKIQAMTLIFGAVLAGVADSATTTTTFTVTETVQATGTGVGTANAVTVFGQLPDSATNQAAVAGSYTDTITVTITY
jgi:spore coat protein U-like protein